MLSDVKPMQWTVEAKPYRPIYRMHRYFARRPHTVFSAIVNHHTEPGDVVLDPFCGGGVTLVESVLAGRRAIGFDINPLATFITKAELECVNIAVLKKAYLKVLNEFRAVNYEHFTTVCRSCGAEAKANWFEHSAIACCDECGQKLQINLAEKKGAGLWVCPSCKHTIRFSPTAETKFVIIDVSYSCAKCGNVEVAKATDEDSRRFSTAEVELREALSNGLWIPEDEIPDCNMERESALHKKGILKFNQLFTSRHLLLLARLHGIIGEQDPALQQWLYLAFSSTLRYTNRMVTRNPAWRKDRPLEWAKPGYWLPPVHLEANVEIEFSRRCDAIVKAKGDYQSHFLAGKPISYNTEDGVLRSNMPAFSVRTLSSTSMPLPDGSIDAIVTDPPYGSYVHYADLSNFWAVWLKGVKDMGTTIDNEEEAVIARKKFPGAKTTRDYQLLLERCFIECHRVLKDGGYMVLTFNNREPRAWASLLVAATKAGFTLPTDGIRFQDGIASYKHTAQSRRVGSVIGDFVFSFRKSEGSMPLGIVDDYNETDMETKLVHITEEILEREGPMTPDALMTNIYLQFIPILLDKVRTTIHENGSVDMLLGEIDQIGIFDSHRRHILEQHFQYSNGLWAVRSG